MYSSGKIKNAPWHESRHGSMKKHEEKKKKKNKKKLTGHKGRWSPWAYNSLSLLVEVIASRNADFKNTSSRFQAQNDNV